MKLNKTYIIGCNIMFYELDMIDEYIASIIGAMTHVDNRENVHVHICWNKQEYLERLDVDIVSWSTLDMYFQQKIRKLSVNNIGYTVEEKTSADSFYNIAQYRREFNERYCNDFDFLIWGETDSMFPSQLFGVIEGVAAVAEQNNIHKYIINFADRKNWDSSWDVITHPMYEHVKYIDELEWLTTNEASSKSYMTYDRMCEINDSQNDLEVSVLKAAKFDGSCLIISSDMILAGVNIPLALTHCGEDTSFGVMAERILANNYVQYCVKNILRVHNRRHPRKRKFILGENNPMGFVGGGSKGDWWDVLEHTSKLNLGGLFQQSAKFIRLKDVLQRLTAPANV